MHELVSIIIPCYNKSRYIGETIESALNQTYPNIEVIVVNDGSTDDSLEQIKRFVPKGITLIQQENQGVCITRNNGIRHASGQYIVPLDADDILEFSYVERCIECFHKDPSLKLVYTQGDYFGQRHGSISFPPYLFDTLLWYSIIPATSMYRKEDFNQTIGYNPNMTYALEDWDFYLTLMQPSDKAHLIDEVLFHYRIVELARNSNIENNKEAIFKQIYRNHPHLYTAYNDILLFAHDQWKEYLSLYNNVCRSKAYRLGKILLKPFSIIRQIFSRCHQ